MDVLLICAAVLANVAFVDPFIGTEGTGHCTPAATCPFGMVQPGPDTGNGSWKYCSGYQHSDRGVDGFSQTHLNGTGQPEMADFLILPFCGETVLRRSAFSPETERAAPGYYAVSLDGAKVDVEITATERVAHYRFKYKAERPRLLVDLQHFLWQEEKYSMDTTKGGGATFSADGRSMSGWREAKAYWPHHKVHFHATFSRPIAAKRMLEKDGTWEMAPRYVLDFDLKPGDELQVKMALSYSSEAGAERNLNAEDAAFDFDAVRARAEGKWQSLLGRVELESATADQRKMFYTSLYHLCVQPNLISDAGERIRYSTFSLWDTYRAAHPLYTILFPEMVEPFLGSFLDHAKETGFMPIWEIYGKEGYDMIGAHSIPVVLDACRKGFKVRLEDFYPYVRDTQTKDNRAAHACPDFEKCHWETYDRLGYFPYDVIAWGSLCRLMEVTFDDHCAAEMAKLLGKEDDERFFRKRSGYWKNAFNPQTGYLAPRKTDGTWLQGYDPHWLLRKDEQGHLVGDTGEGSGLQWSFHVLHDFDGLVKAMGGRDEFLRRLDYLFSHRPFWRDRKELTDRWPYRDASGLVGEYSHGNEPCHHIAYFYSLAGRRDKTAAVVSEIARTLYPVTADGMCGNDDCGQLSAWYVFAAFGFYPVNPASAEYVLGAPLCREIRVHLSDGGVLTIRDERCGDDVQYNGNKLMRNVISHRELLHGGRLCFNVGE